MGPRFCALGFAVAAIVISSTYGARAELMVKIDKSEQRMTVEADGVTEHTWRVSTGRNGFGTPTGHFRPQWTARRYFSRKYYNSPMPHAIFFHQGFAIHGTEYISRLGGPASHGCVRLHPNNAASLFALVKQHGMTNTQIVVTGSRPTTIARRGRPKVGVTAAREERVRTARRSASAKRPAYYDISERRPVYYPEPVYYGPRYRPLDFFY